VLLKLDTRRYHTAMAALNRAIIMCRTIEDTPKLAEKKTDKVEKEIKQVFGEILTIVHDSIVDMGMPVSAMAVSELRADLEKEINNSFEEVQHRLDEIDNTIRREISRTKIFVISDDRIKYIEPDAALFGPDVDLKFPQTASDIEESGSCLSLGRSTACVFHLMRVMEVGLRALHECLGLPDPTGADRNWGRMLDAMKKEMEKRAQNGNAGWKKGDKQLFVELHGSLDAVRSAWRNQTMHIERRYDDEEAEHAFLMVKQFTKKLASRCDENGEPKA
jgi:hypothetical protein